MQEFIDTYTNNADNIKLFLIETIYNLGDLSAAEELDFKPLYSIFPSLELVYICDKKNLNQISDNIYKNKTSNIQRGRNRKYLLNKVKFDSSKIAVSKPYISSATGKTCITLAKQENNKVYFLDFTLSVILERLGLIEIHEGFNNASKIFYSLTATVMMILALFAVGSALYEFINALFFKTNDFSVEFIFKPIIALTLGLAVFDLGKTIFEQEVLFKSYSKSGKAEYKVLTKFSVTILIALLIEALLVVFKISITDYSEMIYAVYLIAGVSILVVALGIFVFFTKKENCSKCP